MTDRRPDPAFWRGRRVLLTGHSGFKGAWAAIWLKHLGAEIHGFALAPDTEPSLWEEAGEGLLTSETRADIADADALGRAVGAARPQVVLHLAAQPLVGLGYQDPVGTARTNSLGTVNLLEALRGCDALEAAVIVTTDKVYANDGSGRPFAEGDALGGNDPYAASKAAAEMLAFAFAQSFFEPRGIAVATARAGNAIGGGDWSAGRLVPDIWRAAACGRAPVLRAPASTRPWQHVLDCLAGYLLYAQDLDAGKTVPRALNFGPPPETPVTVAELAEAMLKAMGIEPIWQAQAERHLPEATSLSLDSSLACRSLGWRPRLKASEAVAWTAAWYASHRQGAAAGALCRDQIARYEALP